MDCWMKDNCKQLHCNDDGGCLIKLKLEYLYKEANISDKLRKDLKLFTDADGTDYDQFMQLKEIKDNIVDFVNNGRQLYIHSSQCGNGKSSWAIKLMQTYFKKIWLRTELKCKGLFIHVPSYLLAMKANISERNEYYQHIRDNILTADLVIWDDIATKASTAYEAENLLAVIDTRIHTGKANIFTSNLNDVELHRALGDMLASRISNLDYNIEFKGGDKRSFTNYESK